MNQKLVIEERKLKSGDELFTVLPRWNTSSESLFNTSVKIYRTKKLNNGSRVTGSAI